MLDRILVPINDKLAPSLHGEMGIIAGGFAKFGFRVGRVEIATCRSRRLLCWCTPGRRPSAGRVQDYLPWLFRSSMRSIETRAEAAPIKLDKQDLGRHRHVGLRGPLLAIEGFEPHFARLGRL